MKFDLIISDYDGTLGGASTNTIDKETVDAINAFTNKGGKFVVCTGRMFASAQAICKSVNLNGIVVAFQGAMIKDIQSGYSYFSGGLSPEVASKVVESFMKEGEQVVAFIGDELYHQNHKAYLDFYQHLLKVKSVGVSDLAKTILEKNQTVSKVCILCDKEKAFALADKYNEIMGGKQVIFNNGADVIVEAVNPNYTKKFAVEFLAKHFNIPYERIMTVGDSTNDIGLMQGAWHGVAVGNAREELKAYAKEVTVPFSEKPVKYLIEKYCLEDEK